MAGLVGDVGIQGARSCFAHGPNLWIFILEGD